MDWDRNWMDEGKRTAMQAPDGCQAICEGLHKQACAEREKRIAQLEHEGIYLKAAEARCLAEMNAAQMRPEHVLKISLAEGILWLLVAVAFIWAGYELALHTLPLLAGFEESSHVLALIFAIGTAVSLEWFLRRISELLPDSTLRIWMLFLALFPVLCLLAGTLSMSLLRGQYVAAKAAATQMSASPLEGRAASPGQDSRIQDVANAFYRASGRLGTLLMVLAAMGLELAAAITLHEAICRIFPACFGLRIQRRLKAVQKRMLACATEIEKWKSLPDLMREEFQRGALLVREVNGRLSEQEVEKSHALSLSVAILLFILAFAAFFVAFAGYAFSAESVVVALDLSTSSQAGELKMNMEAVEQAILRLKPGSRLSVIPINEKSFTSPYLLQAELSREKGLFGERTSGEKKRILHAWREKSLTLRAGANGTDILGALLKAVLIFEESPQRRPLLILLSDARLVSHGYNFERLPRIPMDFVARMSNSSLIPQLNGGEVWVLGVHPLGVTDIYWMSLRAFWLEFFKKAGARTRIFSPDRRLPYEQEHIGFNRQRGQ